jgi:catechol-2,3-dioxygenase
VAIRCPTRAALADALQRVLDAGIALTGASDHGVSEALYLQDPDDNERESSSSECRNPGVHAVCGAG